MGSAAAAAKGLFDASKTGEIPDDQLDSPPEDKDAVYVRLVDSSIGYGVFAARDFEKGEYIFHEAPMIPATDFCQLRLQNDLEHGSTQRDRLLAKLSVTESYGHVPTRYAFPKLAAQIGLSPPTWAAVRDYDGARRLGANLVHGRLACGEGQTLTEEEYNKHINSIMADSVRGRGPATTPVQKTRVAADFFRAYAFQAKPPDNTVAPNPRARRQATIYLVASLVNHCCTPRQRLRKRVLGGDSGPATAAASRVSVTSSKKSGSKENGDNHGGDGNGGNKKGGSSDEGDDGNPAAKAKPAAKANPIVTKPEDPDAITPAPPLEPPKTTTQEFHGTKDVVSDHSGGEDGEGGEANKASGEPVPLNAGPNLRHQGPNCEWRIGSGGLARFVLQHHIAVRATRPIRAGEELLWDYGKKEKNFTCLCPTCDRGLYHACSVL
ncbi:hypothetical protein QBC41DRAFT_300605 [Cercophora samala]|uniref:SET domain-containing protein n=1 Tax=Cercophora samala TaxID=330535 RepID=A0AA39ZI08_9PEZI|nr:hypothetical protein QBC41DRAFT_300605 [Cercophora samala]